MNRVEYFLVCNETRSKLYVGTGAYVFDTLDVDADALTEFLRDNCAFPLGLGYAHEAYAHYRDYTPDAQG